MVSARYSERPAPLLCIEVWERHKFKTQAAVILRDDRTPITRTQDRMNCATGRCPARVKIGSIGASVAGLFYPQERTSSRRPSMSASRHSEPVEQDTGQKSLAWK
jgi:hypothetical protein